MDVMNLKGVGKEVGLCLQNAPPYPFLERGEVMATVRNGGKSLAD